MEALKSYGRSKLALAAQLRLLGEALERRGSERGVGQCRALMAKLAEDRLTLALLGQFGRGKSSLMNALVGRELLPTGLLPLTSAITILRFGPKERLVIEREGSPFPEVVPLRQLEDYVTERGNPGNGKRVRAAVVEAPVPLLRRGLELVDTPGVGSAIAASTATARAFLPACDAVLFVTSVDTPLTGAELELLDEVRRYVRRIFFVVNKTDLLAERERREVVDFIAGTLAEHAGTGGARIFPLSCRLGLAARRDGDAAAYARSGLAELEDTLSRVLSEEKLATFLPAVADKAIRLLGAECEDVDLRRAAEALSEDARRRRLEALRSRLDAHAALRREGFLALRGHALDRVRAEVRREVGALVATERDRRRAQLDRALARCSWQPSVVTLRRLAGHALSRLRRRVRRWLAMRPEFGGAGVDDACRRRWEQLEANLAEIPSLAAVTLGLQHRARAPVEIPPPWERSESACERALVPSSRRDVRLPPWLAVVPARLARPWLKRHAEREHLALLESLGPEILSALERRVDDVLDEAWDQVSTQAAGIESRVLAIVAGQGAKGVGPAWELDGLHRSLLSLRDEVLDGAGGAGATGEPPGDGAPTTGALPVESRADSAGETDLVDDLQTRGCPVCDHLRRVAFDFFTGWQYALSSDPRAQTRFAGEVGFCSRHAWELEAVSSPVGSSVGYARLAERLSRRLADVATDPAAGAMVEILRDLGACRVCRLLRDAERRYVERLVTFVVVPPGREIYARAQGACLPHLALVVAAGDEDVGRFVLAEAAHRLEEAAEDMQAFVMKTEARRRGLGNEDEADAYWRAITHVAGAKGAVGPWQDNDAR